MEQNTVPSPIYWTHRRVALTTIIVLLVAFGFYLLVRFRLVFFLLFTAIVLSTAITPLVELLTRWKIPRTISIILIALLGLLVLIAFALFLAPLIIEQSATLAALVGSWYDQFHRMLLESSSLLIRRIARQLPSILPLTLPVSNDGQEIDTLMLVEQAINVSGAILRNILIVGAVSLLSAIWILEGERTTRIILLALPVHQRDSVRAFFAEAGQKVGAYSRGLAILTTVVGVLSMVAYAIIGLPNILLLGLLAGIFELVPLIGPLLGAVPAILVAASTDPTKVVQVLIATSVIQILENNLLVPRVMDRAVGVNPIASLLAFLTFGSLFGFVGALLAVPLAAVLQIILTRLLFNSRPGEQTPIVRRSMVSILRYDAQKLVQDMRKQMRERIAQREPGADQVEDNMESVVQDLDSILAEVERNQNETEETA
jgi:predicted PurR-regulated permease PerM